jgi:hypothetical protein
MALGIVTQPLLGPYSPSEIIACHQKLFLGSGHPYPTPGLITGPLQTIAGC